MRTLLLAVVALSVAVSAGAAESLESVRAAATFNALPSATAFRVIKFKRARRAELSTKPPARTVKSQAAKLYSVGGWLNLNGSGFHNSGGFAYVPVSGWVSLTDGSGAPVSGNVYMNGTAMVSVSGSFASGWVTPQAWVSIYDGGKLLGTMLVQGQVYVSGFANGNWVNVSGSGRVGGQMWVDDKP